MSTMTIPVAPAARPVRPVRPVAVRRDVAPGPVRLTRRGRVVLALAVFLLVAGLFVALGGASMASGDKVDQPSTRIFMVHSGDTLWRIAHGLTAGESTDEMVQQLMEMNQLENGLIRPGQKLRVPVV